MRPERVKPDGFNLDYLHPTMLGRRIGVGSRRGRPCTGQYQYRCATITATDPADGSADGVVSIDSSKHARQLRLYKLWLEHRSELEERFGRIGQSLLEEARKAPDLLTSNYRAPLLTVERPVSQ